MVQSNRGETIHGFVTLIGGQEASMAMLSGGEVDVPLRSLKRREGVSPKRVISSRLAKRCAFSIDDEVYFYEGKKKITGRVIRLNPKRARIDADDGLFWNVSYDALHGKKLNSKRQRKNVEKLTQVAERADELLAKHQLHEWRFTFDHANRRAGHCIHRQQLITLSGQFCLIANDDEITDTILHEIAHALVDPKHGHNKVWQAKAREIGCSANVTHCVEFSVPKYIISCSKCGTHGTRYKRKQNSVCARCHTPILYENYSESLWTSYRTQD